MSFLQFVKSVLQKTHLQNSAFNLHLLKVLVQLEGLLMFDNEFIKISNFYRMEKHSVNPLVQL